MPNDSQPTVRVAPWVQLVTIFPEDEWCCDAGSFSLFVTYQGRGLWAVRVGGSQSRFCLNRDGEQGFEYNDTADAETWLAAYRFDLDTALQLAREHAPKVRVMHHTATEQLAWHREHDC